MRDEDKLFDWITGNGRITLEPRGIAGWRALGWWFAALALIVGAALVIAPYVERSGAKQAFTIGLLLVVAGWIAAFVLWTRARSAMADRGASGVSGGGKADRRRQGRSKRNGKVESDGAWFAPKRHGMGTGLPIAWQGWLMMALHVGAILGAAHLLHGHQPAQAIAIVLITLVPFPLYAAKTRGGWRWRWGGRD